MLVTRDTEIEALLGRLTAEIRRSSNDSLVSPGEPFHFKAAGKDWLINWYMVREVGVTLCGPPPRAVVPKISQFEFVEAVREQAEAWKEWVFKVSTPCSPCAGRCTRIRMAGKRRRSRRHCGHGRTFRSGHR